MAEFHGLFVIIRCGVNTTHHTLVITEEEDGQAGNAIDGREKLLFLPSVDHVGFRDEIHGGNYRC